MSALAPRVSPWHASTARSPTTLRALVTTHVMKRVKAEFIARIKAVSQEMRLVRSRSSSPAVIQMTRITATSSSTPGRASEIQIMEGRLPTKNSSEGISA
jgi:hypothetical protein